MDESATRPTKAEVCQSEVRRRDEISLHRRTESKSCIGKRYRGEALKGHGGKDYERSSAVSVIWQIARCKHHRRTLYLLPRFASRCM